MPDERVSNKIISKRRRGERIRVNDYNNIVEAVTRPETVKYALQSGVPLFANAHAAVPAYSVFGINTTNGSGNADETPVLVTQVATTSALRLFTNSEIPMTSGSSSYIEVIGSTRVKIDADPSDAGFVIGKECGPNGSMQAKSTGRGLVCLSNPITYETTKKYIWAVAKTNNSDTRMFVTPGGGIPARSGTTLGSATCTMLSVAGGTRATTSITETVYNDFLTAISGSVDIIATGIDGIWVVFAEDCT